MFRKKERLDYIRSREIDFNVDIPVKSMAYYQGLVIRQKYAQQLICQDVYFSAMCRLTGKNAKHFHIPFIEEKITEDDASMDICES